MSDKEKKVLIHKHAYVPPKQEVKPVAQKPSNKPIKKK